MNRDGYGTKAFLAGLFSLVFALGAGWAIYCFGNENIAAALAGALILIVRDIISKLFGIVRSNGSSPPPQ